MNKKGLKMVIFTKSSFELTRVDVTADCQLAEMMLWDLNLFYIK